MTVRAFMDSAAGKAVAAAAVLVAAAAVYLSFRANFGQSSAAAMSRERTFICAQANEPFEYTLAVGDRIPVKSPHSGQNTGYPAELCYWTADGRVKEEPTPVLLRSHVGEKGPTFCPDCGRLVVGHNPRPDLGDTNPPPTKEQYKPRPTRARD